MVVVPPRSRWLMERKCQTMPGQALTQVKQNKKIWHSSNGQKLDRGQF
jgi:hypothetical protein